MARVYCIVGMGYGDEGKGSVTDFLTRASGAKLVVRYNGGAQAAHTVTLPSGRSHIFSQFGSGSFVPGVGTHLSRYMLVNPLTMFPEAEHLMELGVQDIWDRTTIEREALITNPYQVAANRLRELCREALLTQRRTGDGRHGSCGMGIGETVSDALSHPEDALRIGDLADRELTRKKLQLSRERKIQGTPEVLRVPISPAIKAECDLLEDAASVDDLVEAYTAFNQRIKVVDREWLTKQVNGEGVVIFEGAQGALLDEDYGFSPYTTWSHCTFKNAQDLLKDHTDQVTRVGVTRTYMTRHGRGPFVTEDPEWKLPELHNHHGEWQEGFRVGYFDVPAIHYAMSMLYDSCNQPLDMFAMTHMDVVPPKFCTDYDPIYLKYLPLKDQSVGRQEKLTEILMRPGAIRPKYQAIDRMEDFIDYIETDFGTKIGIFSYGPTHEDKSLHNANHY